MNPHQRLKEYGMYIRKNSTGTYNLGWTESQRPGGLAEFPTWDDAFAAFEELVGAFWEYKLDDFQQFVETNLYLNPSVAKRDVLNAAERERSRQREEARQKLYELTKF